MDGEARGGEVEQDVARHVERDVGRLVRRIHATPTLAAIAVAGAGSQALAWLLAEPGASRTLLEAVVPYAAQSMRDYLGREPAEYVSPETAAAMARAAHARALRLREGDAPVAGVACTATIATDRTKRGDHRCCVATWDGVVARSYRLTLARGARDRAGEERVVSLLLLHALAEACGLSGGLPLGLLEGETLETGP